MILRTFDFWQFLLISAHNPDFAISSQSAPRTRSVCSESYDTHSTWFGEASRTAQVLFNLDFAGAWNWHPWNRDFDKIHYLTKMLELCRFRTFLAFQRTRNEIFDWNLSIRLKERKYEFAFSEFEFYRWEVPKWDISQNWLLHLKLTNIGPFQGNST